MCQGFSHFSDSFASFCIGQIIVTGSIRVKECNQNIWHFNPCGKESDIWSLKSCILVFDPCNLKPLIAA